MSQTVNQSTNNTKSTKNHFLSELERNFSDSNQDFARAYYLFATAKLSETYNSQAIYEKYPLLSAPETFEKLKQLYDQHPEAEEIKRLFTSVLGSYIGNQLASLSDAFQNAKNQLKIPVAELNLKTPDGESVSELLYEDVSEWLKKIPEKPKRQALYDRMATAYQETLAPSFIELFRKENELLANLGYANVIDFYSQTSGHNLKQLGQNGKRLVEETQARYQEKMGAHYQSVTGLSFETEATRADISYVLHGKSAALSDIDRQFPQSRLVELARETFDGLGLDFSSLAQLADFKTQAQYETEVVKASEDAKTKHQTLRRILLDIAHRDGKRSRAYVYPAVVPSEIYLSVKPEGGLDDYSAFFHESGHALHFAYENPELSFAEALLGNNTTTEAYAYLFQNLFMNAHWLTHRCRLTDAQAKLAVSRRALEDLYMLRRYGSKMQFELCLFEGVNEPDYSLDSMESIYEKLLTQGCGFRYDGEGWTRDVDAGFYVADYFTAWSLEAQLRAYLCEHFGNPEHLGEDWYENPAAGAFLKLLWQQGNIPPQSLSAQLGYHDPTNVSPLLKFMERHLN